MWKVMKCRILYAGKALQYFSYCGTSKMRGKSLAALLTICGLFSNEYHDPFSMKVTFIPARFVLDTRRICNKGLPI